MVKRYLIMDFSWKAYGPYLRMVLCFCQGKPLWKFIEISIEFIGKACCPILPLAQIILSNSNIYQIVHSNNLF